MGEQQTDNRFSISSHKRVPKGSMLQIPAHAFGDYLRKGSRKKKCRVRGVAAPLCPKEESLYTSGKEASNDAEIIDASASQTGGYFSARPMHN
jgi:hypothetical protein